MGFQSLPFPKFPTFFIVLFSLLLSFNTSKSQNLLRRGSSLSVEDASDVLSSPDKTFTCGFYGLGQNAYWFSIWFTNSKERSVVWMANRDRPVNGHGSKVTLRRNGAMVLTDVDDSVIWMTNTTSTSAYRAELLDTGNLVLTNADGKILWQSFDYPTDTLLPNQLFTKSTQLISRLGKGNYASGYFMSYFDNDNVLRLMYDGPDISSVYWPNPDYDVWQNGRTSYNSSRIAFLDETGSFLSSDKWQFRAFDVGFGIKRRLTMDYDGNLRLYSLNNLTGSWMISWQAIMEQCKVHGICGRNGICVSTPEPKCSCPPGYEVTEPDNWNKGCKPKFNRSCSNSQQLKFIEVQKVDFYGFDLHYSKATSMESCKKLCLDDCQCEAFSYRLNGEGLCYTKSALFNGYRSPTFPGSIYLKFPVSVEASEPDSLNGSNPVCQESIIMMGSPSMYDTTGKRVRWIYMYWFALAIGAIEVIFLLLEWALNHPITAKVDVYSFGVVILEMVKGIRLSNWVIEDGEEQESKLTRYTRCRGSKITHEVGTETPCYPVAGAERGWGNGFGMWTGNGVPALLSSL
ncbi:hypothetical protein Pint_35319 [Pistacia integerrima]|uniref:Uncharacterized protein n=1 Tax=Pistacia integerrima TaxID=434235 RepID=A0ACC0Y1R4_9ROSI|nr:hypothetical protein Pint_35319 [Pistacia integerrima]